VTRVSTEHGISGHRETYATGRLDGHAMTLAHRGRLRRTRGLICVSRATEGVVRARWRPPLRLDVRVQPNGIDRPATPVARGAGHTVGFLGRFAPEKRVDLLIRAFGVLAAADGAAVLSLAGEGAGEPALRGLVHELGLDDRVRFDGWVDGAAWLPGIDVLALPSVWENCSYALLQALAAGAGVVAAPVGGNPELLPRDALADPTDPAAFAAALARQLREPSQRPALPDRVPTVADMTSAIAGAYAAWVQVDR
jgi:glycosyltransferase involved in cell wall biosynthesis